jgi:dissimilatory sulfite reductase (desulfoviridin) alpha/beta subunit
LERYLLTISGRSGSIGFYRSINNICYAEASKQAAQAAIVGDVFSMPKIFRGNPAVFERKDGKFEIKLQITGGMLAPEQLAKVAEVAEKYGACVHLTVRQEILILGISEESLDKALAELEQAGLRPGSAGMTIRNVVACLGNRYCFKATCETTDLAREIAERLSGEKTPGPLKIAISGCPFPCVRPQFNDIGLMGRVRPDLKIDACTGCGKCVEVCKVGATSIVDGKAVIDYDKCIMCGRCVSNCPEGARYSAQEGYLLFVGGRGSWPPHEGVILCDFLPRDKVIPMIERIVKVYKERGEPKKRLREFINAIGFDEFKRLAEEG